MAETTQIQGFAPQIAPMAEEAFTEAQNIYQQRVGEGYQQPETPLFTPFTQPELQAQQQTLDIAAGPLGRPAIQEAMAMTRQGAGGVGSLIPGLMSPYTEQVAQRAKERFAEDYDRQVINRLMSEATAAGSLRGARTGIERGLAQERKMRGLSDIDIKFLDEAYKQAATLGEQQRRREIAGAPQLSRLGLADVGQQLLAPELQAGVGAAQRGQLDLERRQQLGQELAEQQFPETTLQQYLNFLGLGRAPSQVTTISPDAAAAAQQGPRQTSTLGTIKDVASIIGSAPEIIDTGKEIISAGKEAFDFLFGSGGGYVGGGLASLPAVRMQEGGRPPLLSLYDPTMRDLDLLNARRAYQQAVKSTPSDYAVEKYTPGQRAAMIRNIQSFQPQRKETTLGQLFEMLPTVGVSGLDIQEEQRKSAIAKRAAKVEEAEKGIKTALDIEQRAVERDKIISENVRSTIDAAVAAEESLQEAIKGDRSNEEIASRTAAVDQARRSAYAVLQSEIERLGGDTAAIAALRQYVTNTGAAEGIQEAETARTPTRKQQQTDNALGRTLSQTGKTLEERIRTLDNATKRLDPSK